ncbi:MAG: hypothetical protein JRJ49_10155 [Deltaproteobacteria bacterium]|nr:hypothetical protein [Deltaproteobacteria bacterium]
MPLPPHDLTNKDKIYKIESFVLHKKQWDSLDNELLQKLPQPVGIKFDENIRDNLGDLKNRKGIYIFFLEPVWNFKPSARYLLYVGRVFKKNTFFKRFYEYVNALTDVNTRHNIKLLTNLWPDKTLVYFYDLDLSDNEIAKIEKEIYDKIIPPFNNQFSASATAAKNARSIYA